MEWVKENFEKPVLLFCAILISGFILRRERLLSEVENNGTGNNQQGSTGTERRGEFMEKKHANAGDKGDLNGADGCNCSGLFKTKRFDQAYLANLRQPAYAEQKKQVLGCWPNPVWK